MDISACLFRKPLSQSCPAILSLALNGCIRRCKVRGKFSYISEGHSVIAFLHLDAGARLGYRVWGGLSPGHAEWRSGGRALSGVQGQSPWSEVQVAKTPPPEAENILIF